MLVIHRLFDIFLFSTQTLPERETEEIKAHLYICIKTQTSLCDHKTSKKTKQVVTGKEPRSLESTAESIVHPNKEV